MAVLPSATLSNFNFYFTFLTMLCQVLDLY